MPEVPEQIQENLAHLELEANSPKMEPEPLQPTQSKGYHDPQAANSTKFPPRGASLAAEQYNGHSGYGEHEHAPAAAPTDPYTAQGDAMQAREQDPYQYRGAASRDYDELDQPSFSPFPKLHNPPPNVPPSDEEKEAILESARLPVLNSNDPETQLAWAQDALAYVEVAMQHERRITENDPDQQPRSQTPRVEHQLRVDAINVVTFLADQGHPKAEFMRGMWLEFAKFGFRMDKKEAFRSYVRAAEKRYARAEYRIGMQYENSNEPMKAIRHYNQGAAQGDSASNYVRYAFTADPRERLLTVL
jgi:TPR repeat protein